GSATARSYRAKSTQASNVLGFDRLAGRHANCKTAAEEVAQMCLSCGRGRRARLPGAMARLQQPEARDRQRPDRSTRKEASSRAIRSMNRRPASAEAREGSSV